MFNNKEVEAESSEQSYINEDRSITEATEEIKTLNSVLDIRNFFERKRNIPRSELAATAKILNSQSLLSVLKP